MSTLALGLDPQPMTVTLTTGADFDAELTYTVGGVATSWPVSTVLTLAFDDAALSVWTATIVTSVATFNVDKALADIIPQYTVARLKYVNGTTDRTLFLGTVVRRG